MCWHSFQGKHGVSDLSSNIIKDGLAVLTGFGLFIILIIVIPLVGLLSLFFLYPSPRQSPSWQATLTVVSTLTATYDAEARSAIEDYHRISGSLNARLNPEIYTQVATGPHLERLLSFDIPEGDDPVYIVTGIELIEVRVLEYDEAHMKVVGCGTRYNGQTTVQGELVSSTRSTQFNVIYVFLWEDETWKLATGYTLIDRDAIRRDWAYVSEWEREAIGDIERYADMHFDCGMGGD